MTRLFALAALAFAACHSAKASSTSDPALCTDVFVRARACTADYIPALVDSRARFDQPPGIAAAVREDRAGVISQAMTEWASDSQDDAIARTCAGATGAIGESQAARDCLALTDCAAFTACIMPVFEKRFAK